MDSAAGSKNHCHGRAGCQPAQSCPEKGFGNFWRQTLNAFIDVIFPARCAGCGEFFQPRRPSIPSAAGAAERAGDPPAVFAWLTVVEQLFNTSLCPACRRDFVPLRSPVCTCCGFMFQSRQGPDHLCGECIASAKRFRRARAALAYDRVMVTLIHRFKYRGGLQLAKPLGGVLLAAFYLYRDEIEADLVMPVPLHPGRLKKRGFNQALLLILSWKAAAALLNIPLPGLPVAARALVRTRSTVAQTGLGRRQRRENIKNAFGIREPEKIRGRKILLIDDVYTTGATVDECAGVLIKNGARSVDVLTLARTL